MTTPRRTFLFGLMLYTGGASLGACGTAGAIPPANTLDAGPDVQYKLGPGDQLRITVFNEPDLSGQYVVSQQGNIAYPLVGTLNASGLTIDEFTSQVQTALEAYVRAPNVSIEVANYRPFFILGEVTRPGPYPYSPHLTVQNAVATAGGFTYRANQHRVFIKHAGETSEQRYPLDDLTPVLPGDTVRIGERLF